MLTQSCSNLSLITGRPGTAGGGSVEAVDRLLQRSFQLSLPVRQAEDFLAGSAPADLPGMLVSSSIDTAGGSHQMLQIGVNPPSPAVLLQVAANPFDFWSLIERGIAEWGRTSDAVIGGVPFPGTPDLFRAGLRSGALDLFLGRIRESGDEAVDGPIHDSFSVEGDGQGRQVDGSEGTQLGEQRRGQRPAHLFDIVSVFHRYLQGHLLWVAPEYRGRGLAGGYFDAVLDVARRHGLKGFMFLSTLPFWKWRAPRYGFALKGRVSQIDGPDVLVWLREV